MLKHIENLKCGLDHSGDPEGQRNAVSYFVLQLPNGTMLNIPLCEYCAEELSKDKNFEWYLLYCLECSGTKWLYKKNCKNDYPEQVHFVRSCPDCDPQINPAKRWSK